MLQLQIEAHVTEIEHELAMYQLMCVAGRRAANSSRARLPRSGGRRCSRLMPGNGKRQSKPVRLPSRKWLLEGGPAVWSQSGTRVLADPKYPDASGAAKGSRCDRLAFQI